MLPYRHIHLQRYGFLNNNKPQSERFIPNK